MCVIGALAVYLWFRFDHTGEMDPPPDFTDNKAWFFIKLIVSSTCSKESNMTQIKIKNYADTMKDVLRKLEIYATHWGHFGRVSAPTMLELEEIPKSQIEALGNWCQTMQEECYSAQMPMAPMRIMAGHGKEQGTVFVSRQTKPASVEGSRLEKKIFPFVESALQAVDEATAADGKDRFTAVMFLTLLKNLRQVLLQDVAVMMDDVEA